MGYMWIHVDTCGYTLGFSREIYILGYPLVICYITMERSTIFNR